MIRQKNKSNRKNIYSFSHPEGSFKDCFKVISPAGESSIQEENGRRKLEAAMESNRLVRENSPSSSAIKDDVFSDDQASSALLKKERNSSSASSSSSASIEKKGTKQTLDTFLHQMEQGRRKCELIFGHIKGSDSSQTQSLGVEASDTPGYYERSLGSTATRGVQGWSDFVITYDNKFILQYSDRDIETAAVKPTLPFNHQTMGYGTFLKAAGRIKIEEIKGKTILKISPFSDYLELSEDDIPIILFVLKQKGLPISKENIRITDEKGNPIFAVTMDSKKKNFGEQVIPFYSNEAYFPLAKAIAENTALDAKGMLSKLFLSIDDTILNTRNKKIISALKTESNDLKTAIIEFLLSLTQNELHVLTDTSIETRFDEIVKHIQSVKDKHGIDLTFVKSELDIWIYYLFGLEGRLKEAQEKREEVPSLVGELAHIESDLKEIKACIPERFMDKDYVTRSPFIRFYFNNPTETCITLLRDYTKGGFFWRLLTGAWRRHHIKGVDQFLKKYDEQQYPDNLSIQAIYRELFGQESSLTEYAGKLGTLYARLLFCEKLENINLVRPPVFNEAPSQNGEASGAQVPIALSPSSTPVVERSSESALLTSPQGKEFDDLPPMLTSMVAHTVELFPKSEEAPVNLPPATFSTPIPMAPKRKTAVFSISPPESLCEETLGRSASPIPMPAPESVFEPVAASSPKLGGGR